MKLTSNNGWLKVELQSSFQELLQEGSKISDTSILLLMADGVSDDMDAKTRESLLNAPFLTVFAAENLNQYSYQTLSAFDVRLASEQYSAEKVQLDERYRLLCGETAYDRMCHANCEFAENFVTIPEMEDGFANGVFAYMNTLCKEKSDEQLAILVGCIRAAQSGRAAVLKAESEGFYRLMQQKTEGSNG